jgi:hypothetical protein
MDIDRLLTLMVEKSASDLFITAGIPPSMKINGKIVPTGKVFNFRRSLHLSTLLTYQEWLAVEKVGGPIPSQPSTTCLHPTATCHSPLLTNSIRLVQSARNYGLADHSCGLNQSLSSYNKVALLPGRGS